MRQILALMIAAGLLAGCSVQTAPAPPAPVVQPAGPHPISIADEPAEPFRGRLLPYTDQALGVSLSYPEGFGPPEHDRLGGLVVPFDSGDLTVYRMAHPLELSPMESISKFIDESIAAANGRFGVEERGSMKVGGYDAAYVQATFPSAAGRWDRVFVIVPIGDVEYRLSCGTKQGPPVTPWEKVQPVCRAVLETIQLSP